MFNILDWFKRPPSRGVQATPASLPTIEGRAVTMLLREYQQTGVDFLYDTKRGIIADAPGLGKTLQAAEAAVHPTVISAPAHLADQWADFLREQYPTEPVSVAAYGGPLERKKAIEEWTTHRAWLIVNHDMWRSIAIPQIANTVIADEFHHLKGRTAMRSQVFRAYAWKTPRVYGLTATPAHKDLGDLWHQLHILDPEAWPSYFKFIDRFAKTYDYGYGTHILGRKSKNSTALEEALRPYILERTYAQVHLQLPPRIDKDIKLTLPPGERAKYKLLKNDYQQVDASGLLTRHHNPGTVLHELRRMTLTPAKFAAVAQIIDDTPGTEPIIIFTHYKETARLMAERFDGVAIDGDIPPTKRREYALTGGVSRKRVRAITQDSLDSGVDLSHARTVIYPEESYIAGQQYQTMTRVQRVRPATTDNAPVNVYYVYYKGTVDEIIHKKVRARAASALSVLREAFAQS